MLLTDFEALVRQLSHEVPTSFLDGITEVVVSPRTVPHPERPDVFTLGECVPLDLVLGSGPDGIQSRIVLYHGSFAALAGTDENFNWRQETWETLTHELRHHLEWRARAPDLEALDWAVEQNFARQEGESFEPTFFLSGQRQSDGRYLVDEDVFVDVVVRSHPSTANFVWDDQKYLVELPADATLPCFLTVVALVHPPPGELVIVVRERPGLKNLFSSPKVFQAEVRAIPAPRIF